MSALLENTPANRQIMAQAFASNPRVDLSFDCLFEGTAGEVMVDDAEKPTLFRLEQGAFWYFAGDASHPSARAFVKEMPPYTFLMPSPPEWVELAKSVCGRNLTSNPRFTFRGDLLSPTNLENLMAQSRFTPEVQRIDEALAQKFLDEKVYLFDILSAFASASDFFTRGLGYCLFLRDRVVGAAYSAMACSKGIEVSIYVEERHRQRGIATALAACLLLDCLQRGWIAHWDAANPESCKLAEKLGYRLTGEYTGYFLV